MCVAMCRSLRRADHSSRGVVPNMVRHCRDLEISRIRRPLSALGGSVLGKKRVIIFRKIKEAGHRNKYM
jgi:hypothetical protein